MSFTVLNAGARVANKSFYAGASHGMYGYIFADLVEHSYVIERDMNRATKVGVETTTRSVTSIQTKRENGKAIELVTKQEKYTPLMLVKDSPLPPDITKSARKLKKVHPLLSCVRALWEYQRGGHGLVPANEDQLKLFTTIAKVKHTEHMLPAETLKGEFVKEFLMNYGSELSPVTAFLGGQLAQDVINVLGQREQPIQNLVLFDGDDMAGPVYALHPIFLGQPLPIIQNMPVGVPVEVL